jgi:hypothetical protein
MALCGAWSLVAFRHGGTQAHTLWCRSWICSDCEPFRRAALKAFARSGSPKTFLTLTVNPTISSSPANRAALLVDAFRILIRRARAKFTKSPIEYFAVFEATKAGEPHLHVLMRAPYLPQKWISETMRELIDAPIVDIRFIDNVGRAAFYVAKYVGKRPGKFGTMKRYWHSKGYAPGETCPRDKDEIPLVHWAVVKRPLWLIASDLVALGFTVEWDGQDRWTQLAVPPSRAGPWRNPFEEEKRT